MYTNSNLTELIIILDASASMNRVRQEVIDGFNQLIEDQKKGQGECRVTLVRFSSRGNQLTIINNQPLDAVVPLTLTSYVPNGYTALRDAIGSTIDAVGNRLATTPESQRPGKVIVAIMTDGDENDSKEYDANRVKEMVELQRDQYQWEFLFTGANQDAVLTSAGLGMASDLSSSYADSAEGTQRSFSGISAASMSLRSGDRVAASAAMKGIDN